MGKSVPSTSTTESGFDASRLRWHNPRDWGIEGKAFADSETYYERLPARAKKTVRQVVWDLSRNTAGMSVRFETDSDVIYARYLLTFPTLAMVHMPATGVSGMDIYAENQGSWRWTGTIRPEQQVVVAPLATGIDRSKRIYQIHLPLYNGLASLEIGVSTDATFVPIRPRSTKPVLFYGTSITQGACASRPGMGFLNILGRNLNRPILNFGFSGNGTMDLEVGEYLAELDPAIYVIDCLANMDAESIAARTIPLVKLLRSHHPATPILLVEDRTQDDAQLRSRQRQEHADRRGALRKCFDSLRDAGVPNVSYLSGDGLLGSDGEATVDGSHPNDLGMMRYANVLEPELRRILGAPKT